MKKKKKNTYLNKTVGDAKGAGVLNSDAAKVDMQAVDIARNCMHMTSPFAQSQDTVDPRDKVPLFGQTAPSFNHRYLFSNQFHKAASV